MEVENRSYGIYPVGDCEYLLTTGPDIISAVLRSGHVWEPFLLDFAAKLIGDKPNPVILDIGANLGAFTVPMSKRLAGRGAMFHAFEPQSKVFYQLCANLYINGVFNCHAYHKAIGEYDGKIDIQILDVHSSNNVGSFSLDHNTANPASGQAFESVDVAQLDSLDLPAADFIKIDIEGWEYHAFVGAQKYLKACGYPPIIFELWGDHVPYIPGLKEGIDGGKKAVTLLKEMGYELTHLQEMDTCIAQHKSKPIIELD